jgi:hypothetical protein
VRKVLVITVLLGLLSNAFAFKWTFDQWPAGNQNYTFEVRSGEGEAAQVATIDVAITDTGGQFDITTTMTVNQTGISQADLGSAAFGGSAIGMFAFGPMLFYGPAFMMLPMMIGEEDISVRSEPLSVMGMGKIYMDKSEQIAGHDCVVMRLEMQEEGSDPMEFAVAEGLPIPCYSKYGTGSDTVEIRLIKAEMTQ